MQIEKAHLYVEKYNKEKHEILLDFVQEEEFLFLRNHGDYVPGMKLERGSFEPTMLLVHDCRLQKSIREGDLITVDMRRLVELSRNVQTEESERQRRETPAIVFQEFRDGKEMEELLEDSESCTASRISREFVSKFKSSWVGRPCALEYLDDEFELNVWNVGQGSTNSIYDGENLTLFDFGASIYSTKEQLENMLRDHSWLLEKAGRISLIISHWDCDHYNFLSVVPDGFLRKLCCVFYPSEAITLTAKQIEGRIEKLCSWHTSIPSACRVSKYRCGMRCMQGWECVQK